MITQSIQAGQVYQISVAATNAVGEGEHSDVLSIMAASVPSAPSEVTMHSQSATMI